ncbi:MAG: enoyl-CoA hydratase [Erythrobacter sp.]|nr:enoyl-CoA hydratase [Erythrobacter sp.]
MFATESTSTNLVAAVFALGVSAVLYAAAIVPASPTLFA